MKWTKKEVAKRVSDYVRLDAEIKAKEKVLKRWRADIESHMFGNNVLSLRTPHGAIEILEQNKAVISARYTSYEIEALLKVTTPDIVRNCVVERVDRDLVDDLVSKKVIPKSIETFKTMSLTDVFSVKCFVDVPILVPGDEMAKVD